MPQEYLYTKVIRYVTDIIKKHASEEDYKLPSEKQLELKLGVSNITVKTALKQLESDGLIVRHQGKGTFINKSMSKAALDQSIYNIAVCILPPDSHFLREIMLGINEFCYEKSINPFYYVSYNNPQLESRLMKSLKKMNYDGLIVYPSNGKYFNEDLIKLSTENYPIVILDREAYGINVSFVSSNHYKITFDTVARLIEEGIKEIGIVLEISQTISSVNDRYRGYVDAHIKNNLKVRQEYILDDGYSSESNEDFMRSATYPKDCEKIEKKAVEFTEFLLNSPKLEAVITANGLCFLAMLKAVQNVKKNTGRIIRLLTYDNDFDDIKPLVDVSFESLSQKAYKIGYSSAKQLFNLITGTGETKKIIIE